MTGYRYMYRGRLMTVAQLARLAGIGKSSMHDRINAAGGEITDDVVKPPRRPRTLEFRGEQRTIKEIAQITGKSIPWVYQNMRGNMVLDRHRPIADPASHPNWPVYSCDGITDTLSGWAKRMGMHPMTLHCRIKRYGWSVRRALTEPVMTPNMRKRGFKVMDIPRPDPAEARP